MSQVELARRIGRHQTVIGPYERDEYEPPRDVVEKLALVLETSPEYLYFGRSPQQIALAGGRPDRPRRPARADAEPRWSWCSLRDEQLRRLPRRDDSMAPVFRPGQLVLVLAAAGDEPAALLGRDVLVELADGRLLLRRLMPGADPDRFDLAGLQRAPSTLGGGASGPVYRRCAVAEAWRRAGAAVSV